MPRYPWRRPIQLGRFVEHAQPDPALRVLDRILAVINASSGDSLAVRKLRCAQIAGFCLRGARRGGAPGDQLYDRHLNMLDRLTRCRNWRAVTRLVRAYIRETTLGVRQLQTKDIDRLVDRIRHDIQTNPPAVKPLGDYARDGGVSVEHLSRRFSAVIGCSYSEHRRLYRVRQAARLLDRTTLKIRAVSAQVGMKDVSRFIAVFRRETGLTPAAYRRLHHARRM